MPFGNLGLSFKKVDKWSTDIFDREYHTIKSLTMKLFSYITPEAPVNPKKPLVSRKDVAIFPAKIIYY